jgi:2-polyprenyl-3-methyl-5-hydroxy-6-metoxy-1,4-benzoquinol methylase
LLAQQVAEPRAEAFLRSGMARLTAIDNAASREVRTQYEANPYPKWAKLPGAEGASPQVRAALSGALADPARRVLDVLVAGCGTGQESIEIARGYGAARVLAVDLSLASLGYAARKARELGVANLEHGQADIMGLGALGTAPGGARGFDVISCVGVLHHLGDPLAGWRVLLGLLRPGGSMMVGLYSERGRADVLSARAFIAGHGYPATPDGIRECRQALAAAPAQAAILQRRDFFTVSECRDLLFPVEEHRFTLPQVARMIAELEVAFTGFVLEPRVLEAYRERFPADTAMTDLAAWDAFEGEFPATFSGMYVFRVRKHA